MNKVATLLLSYIVATHATWAQNTPVYEYLTDGTHRPYPLGSGVVPSDLARLPSLKCIEGAEDPQSMTGWDNVHFSATIVTNYASLLQAQNLSIDAHAQSPTSKLHVRFGTQRNEVSDSRNVSIVVSASQIAPPRYFSATKLTARAQSLLDLGELSQFKEECGTQFVIAQRRGLAFDATITIKEASQSLRDIRSGSISASGQGPAASGGFSAAFNSEFKSAQGDNRIEVKVQARGGPGLQALAAAAEATIKKQPDIDAIGKAMASYFAQINSVNEATIVSFLVADYPGLNAAYRDPWTHEKGQRLIQFVERYWHYDSRQSIATQIANGSDKRFGGLDEAGRGEYQVYADRQGKAKAAMVEPHRQCLASMEVDLDKHCSLKSLVSTETIAADKDKLPSAAYRPNGTWGLAVMRNNKWTLLNRLDTHAVFRSQAANDMVTTYMLDHTGDYRERLLKRIQQTVGRVDAYVLLYLIDAETLESITLKSDRLESSVPRVSVLKEFGRFQVQTDESLKLSGAPLNLIDPKYKYGLRLLKYPAESAPIPLHFDFGGQWVTQAAQPSANSGGAGSGDVVLELRDYAFPGDKEVIREKIRSWEWNHDDTLGIKLVTYRNSTGEPEDKFIVAPSKATHPSFPTHTVKLPSGWIRIDNRTSTRFRPHQSNIFGYGKVIDYRAELRNFRPKGFPYPDVNCRLDFQYPTTVGLPPDQVTVVFVDAGTMHVCREREYLYDVFITQNYSHHLRQTPYSGPMTTPSPPVVLTRAPLNWRVAPLVSEGRR